VTKRRRVEKNKNKKNESQNKKWRQRHRSDLDDSPKDRRRTRAERRGRAAPGQTQESRERTPQPLWIHQAELGGKALNLPGRPGRPGERRQVGCCSALFKPPDAIVTRHKSAQSYFPRGSFFGWFQSGCRVRHSTLLILFRRLNG
jgi:hypothetical protein